MIRILQLEESCCFQQGSQLSRESSGIFRRLDELRVSFGWKIKTKPPLKAHGSAVITYTREDGEELVRSAVDTRGRLGTLPAVLECAGAWPAVRLLQRALTSKGGAAFVRRLGLVGQRFRWTPEPMARALALYAAALRAHDAPATWTVAVASARRHPTLLCPYAASRIEFALHGWCHTDHQRCDADTQGHEVQRAVEGFAQLGFQAAGWRSPYLRAGPATLTALMHAGLQWDASETVEFPCHALLELHAAGRDSWQRAVAFYGTVPYEARLALPTLHGPLVRFPTALPDDEMLIDRLGVGAETLTCVWLEMLARTYADGELLVLLLHPERTLQFLEPLHAVLAWARAARPGVWIATLGELAAWWRRRSAARLAIQSTPAGWVVTVDGPPGVLAERLEHSPTPRPAATARARQLVIASAPWPGVGVSGRTAAATAARLQALGLAAEPRQAARRYAAELHDPTEPELVAYIRQLGRGEGLAAPLVRLAYWPDGARSALAITGDICALTWRDFLARLAGRG
jgi:hypothetical protein